MKKLKNDKAITLIALVVTIIILLILAGVTMGFAMNGTGLFEKAKLATDEYNNKVEQEENRIAGMANDIDYMIGTRNTKTNIVRLWKIDKNANNANNGKIRGTIELSDSINNYDALRLVAQKYDSNGSYGTNDIIVFKDEYYGDDFYDSYYGTDEQWGIPFNDSYFYFAFIKDTDDNQTNSRKINLFPDLNRTKLVAVYGIKYN